MVLLIISIVFLAKLLKLLFRIKFIANFITINLIYFDELIIKNIILIYKIKTINYWGVSLKPFHFL